MNLFGQLVGLLGPPSALRKASTYTQDYHNTEKRGHAPMSRVGFEPSIPVFEQPKAVRASDLSAIGTHVSINRIQCIALGYGLDDRGSRVRFPAGAGNFSLHHRLQNGSGAHPASYTVGTRGSFPGVKRPGCEADHSPPSSAEVKEWVELFLHSLSKPSWRAAWLKKHRDNFTFLFIIMFNWSSSDNVRNSVPLRRKECA
jgi:hypothetical protein